MKSRHLFLTLLALVPFMPESRTLPECQMIARDILGGDVQSQLRGRAMTMDDTTEPYLVFNAQGRPGFAVVSTDDRLPALIGYSHDSDFDSANMPPQLSVFLDAYTSGVEVRPSSAVFGDEELVLPTAKFNQYAPYNDLCPAGTVTGCVATAMAIKMAYHKWPDRGRGSHSYVSRREGHNLQMDFDFPIDWDNMLDDYNGGYTKAQGRAVAQLMLACGVASEMDYGSDGSAANWGYASNALFKNFYYSPESCVIRRDCFDDQEWHDLMHKSLKDNGPLLYVGGNETDGTHAFIIDGYKNEYYHVNWGWGGANDGFYLLSAMVPNSHFDFSYIQSAMLNVNPDYQKKDSYCPFHITKRDKDDLAPGLVTDARRVTDGDFFVATRCLTNSDLISHQGNIAALLVDDDGVIKAVLGSNEVNCPTQSSYHFFTITCHAELAAVPGDKIVLGYREHDFDNWTIIPGDGCVTSWIDAYDNMPLMCPMTWDVDNSLGVSTRQSYNEALYDSHYYFTIHKQPIVDDVSVTVNGVPINPYGTNGDFLFYDFEVDQQKEYEIVAKAQSSVDIANYAPFMIMSDEALPSRGLVSDAVNVTVGNFVVSASILQNIDFKHHTGTLAAFLKDKHGTVKCQLGTASLNCPSYSFYHPLVIDAHSDVDAVEGDYIELGYREAEDGPWLTVISDGRVPARVSAFGNSPVFADVVWSIDPKVTISKSNLPDRILLNGSFAFGLKCPHADDRPVVYVNGSEINPYTTSGDYTWFMIRPTVEQSYTVRCTCPGAAVLAGDANGDGSLTVTDIVCVVSLILGEDTGAIDRVAADINGDGAITVIDVVRIVDLILAK